MSAVAAVTGPVERPKVPTSWERHAPVASIDFARLPFFVRAVKDSE